MTIPQPEFEYMAVAVGCALIGAAYDMQSRRVPNFLTAPALILGLALHASVGGWHDLGAAALGALISGGIFFVLFLAGGMGAGDVKLIAAVACIAGLPQVASLLILTALAGGVMALALVLVRQRFRQTVSNVGALFTHHRLHGLEPHPELNVENKNNLRLPYAVAIAAGSALTMTLLAVKR
ncbi:MAG: prepilin peptidase [Chloroflexota bacterium]